MSRASDEFVAVPAVTAIKLTVHVVPLKGLPAKAIVAVKQCRAEVVVADLRDFFAEIEVMKKFSSPPHPNVGLLF